MLKLQDDPIGANIAPSPRRVLEKKNRQCEDCGEFVIAAEEPNWKKRCFDCYKSHRKSLKTIMCTVCGEAFKGEDWKTMCGKCYKNQMRSKIKHKAKEIRKSYF